MPSEHRAQGSTRNQILQLLRRNGEMTAGELSDSLGVGAVGVRQHLALMCSENLVTTVGVRRGLGRPSHLYGLTPRAEELFPKAYERIALDALGYIAATGGSDTVEQVFEARRQKLAMQLREQLAGPSVQERVRALAAVLNEQGYMCEWNCEDDGTLTLTEHNCPIDCVARAFPQACSSELRLYEDLLEVQLKQEATISAGAASCRYTVIMPNRTS